MLMASPMHACWSDCSSARAPSGASVRHSNDSAIVVLSFIVPSRTGGFEAHIQARATHLYETRWAPKRFSLGRIIVIIEFILSRCRPKPGDFRKNQVAFTKISVSAFFALHAVGGRGSAALGAGAVERHALNAADGTLFRRQRARVDAHPGDLRRQPAVFDLRATVHHH